MSGVRYSLNYVKTSDGITLDGAIAAPQRKTKSVILWIHGLGGNFYSGRLRLHELARGALRNNVALASFNTRGHNTVASFHKNHGRLLAGAGLENFKDCLKDISAIIRYLKSKGLSNVYLVGHSTGANKALYYLYKTSDRQIKGLALVAPLSDVAVEKRAAGKKFSQKLLRAKKYLSGYRHWPLPKNFSKKIMSASRYLSLANPGSPEDVFPYHNPNASWKELKSLRVPLLVVLGDKDHYAKPWQPKKILKIFEEKTPNKKMFSGMLINGAGHSFVKREKELAAAILRWTTKNC